MRKAGALALAAAAACTPTPACTLTKAMLLRLALGQAGRRDFPFSNEIDVVGSRTDLLRFFSLLGAPHPNFAIVRP